MEIQELQTITIASGDCLKLEFDVLCDVAEDISNFTGYFILSPYDEESTNEYVTRMSRVNNNIFQAEISSDDSINLCGNYTAKIVFEDEGGQLYKKARCLFVVKPDTNSLVVG